jgi:hypothetical protein
MKWLDQWLYGKVRDMWDNRHKYEADRDYKEAKAIKMSLVGAQAITKGLPEGEDRITFELSTAIGGKILNVRRYDQRTDRHESSTYVVPNGEDLSERIVKILNLEMFK